MTGKTSNFTLGLFVVIGLMIGIAAIVWLGASRYFRQGTTYVTYFDESVQGLEMDSAVKFRGVEIGRVKKIQVAPDHKLIEVMLTIYRKELIGPDIVAEKSITGLSGGSYINLSPGKPAEFEQSPKLKFSSRYPVIPSKPSEFGQILTDADKTMGSLKDFDFKGLSDQMKATAKSVQDFVADPRMDRIKGHIEAVSAHLDATSRKIDNIVNEGDVKEVLEGTRQTLADTRELIAEMRREMKAMDLPGTTESAKRVIQGMDSRTSRISSDVRSAIDSLEETSDSLDSLIQRLNENPSDIIFSKPQPVRKD